jgi:hypothetical protein
MMSCAVAAFVIRVPLASGVGSCSLHNGPGREAFLTKVIEHDSGGAWWRFGSFAV